MRKEKENTANTNSKNGRSRLSVLTIGIHHSVLDSLGIGHQLNFHNLIIVWSTLDTVNRKEIQAD
jgi:hypothetical protein